MPEKNENYHGYSVDTEDQPQAFGDSLSDNRGLDDPLAEGWSPPENWSRGQGYGTTAAEEAQGEPLDERLRQEEPDLAVPDPLSGDVGGAQVGHRRAGRLVQAAAGARAGEDAEMYATDVGIDGAGASAEEAAVHVIAPEDLT